MFCDQCGAAIEPGAKFCEECGASLGSATLRPASGLARGLRSRIWLWLLAGATLLVMGGMFFVFTESSLKEKGSLSRREAAQKIQAYSGEVVNGVGLLCPYGYEYDRISNCLNAFQGEGYLQWEWTGSSAAVTLTEKGKLFLEVWGGAVSFRRANFKAGCEVTGITIDPGEVTAKVYFAVKATEPYKILKKIEGSNEVDILKGEALFRLYDDGWRVESAGVGE